MKYYLIKDIDTIMDTYSKQAPLDEQNDIALFREVLDKNVNVDPNSPIVTNNDLINAYQKSQPFVTTNVLDQLGIYHG